MKQSLALGILNEGKSVLLTGQAGSGKTFVLNAFIRHAKKMGKKVAVTATTGLAATHVNGNTIHSWSGLGIHDQLPLHFFKDMPKGRLENIQKADILVIDEVSMLHDFRLDLINEITKRVRGNAEPFGGLQVVLCGDFFQLPPINRDDQRQGGFIVHSAAWDELDPRVCYLSEQHRQNDPDFLEILTALRENSIRRHHAEKLLSRVGVGLISDQPVTELHTTNINVDNINSRQLANLPGRLLTYQAQFTGKDIYIAQLKRSCLAPDALELKKGALIMCIKNNPEKKYVNGSLGVVEDFEPLTDYPIIRLRNGHRVTIIPESWELRDGDTKRAGLMQLPLRLAWAITIHKSQGMTLDAAVIDLRRAFVAGMGYVALSRVRSLADLSLHGINNTALQVSADALKIDAELRENSEKACQELAHLAEGGKIQLKAAKDKPISDYKQKVNDARKDYPKAYTPWLPEDDLLLKSMFEQGKGVKEISGCLLRQSGSIRARIKKHFGEDAVIKI